MSRPTHFRYGDGFSPGLDLMGEAGPEAIMPLTRGGDGRLGVNASGISAGGAAVYVIIQNYTNEEVRTEESSGSDGSQIRKIIIGTVKQSITGGEMDQSMSSCYGLRAGGFQSQYQDPVIRTQMDAGPVKQRLRYTAEPKQFTASIIVDEAEREIFEAWFTETPGFGTLRFVMQNPQTLLQEEFRFTAAYSEAETDGLFELSLPLERMS